MGKVIMSGIVEPLKAPSTGLPLSTIAEGSIVKITEDGVPVEFYVAKHNYEESLNGAGRTLLVRKDCYDERAWHSSKRNAYASSSIDSWLNGTYKATLDAAVQEAIGTTTFYYTPGNGNNTMTTLSRAVFLLSETELGYETNFGSGNKEGSTLPIASVLKAVYLNGSAVDQWTRTPYEGSTQEAAIVRTNYGSFSPVAATTCNQSYGSRPAFTIPSNSLFDDDAVFVGVG